MLRPLPGILVLRPGDANEVSDAWRVLMKETHEPAVLVLSRQKIPTVDRTKYAAPQVGRGAYSLTKDTNPDVILMGTGSEVGLCLKAHEQLEKEGIKARVVSMPSWELFEKQDEAYRNQVLPPNVRARVAVEFAATFGWERYTGLQGAVLGMQTFGLSAPMKVVAQHFDLDADHVVSAAKAQVARHRRRS